MYSTPPPAVGYDSFSSLFSNIRHEEAVGRAIFARDGCGIEGVAWVFAVETVEIGLSSIIRG